MHLVLNKMSSLFKLVQHTEWEEGYLTLLSGTYKQLCHEGCTVKWCNTIEPIMVCQIEKYTEEWDKLLGDQTLTTRVLPKDMFELIKKHIRSHKEGRIVYIFYGETKM